MNNKLPPLNSDQFAPTRAYLQNLSKVIGKLQQAFLEPEPHGWQYGLNVNLRGICSQPFMIKDKPITALIDLVTHKFRLGKQYWSLEEYSPDDLLKIIQNWIRLQGDDRQLELPQLQSETQYDRIEAHKYAELMWWLEQNFSSLKQNLASNKTSPILLYPHHFDLSLVRYIDTGDGQISIGFAQADSNIEEPYIYLTSYPKTNFLRNSKLPSKAYWNQKGFQGIVLPYSALRLKPNETMSMLMRLVVEF